MAALRRCLLFLFNFSLFSLGSLGFLDIDEIQNTHYGIELLKTPVSLTEESTTQMVLLSTIHGQKYRCNFPDHTVKREQADEKEAEQIGIPELLRPLEEGPCLVTTKDWWTYEFCYGKYLQQYHMEDGVPVGKVIYLGFYDSEYNWKHGEKETSKQNKERLNRYHSQQYVNGTVCDLTNKPRRVEVRFQCEDGSGDYISRIDEPESCVYVLVIHTSKICHHPYLKPLSPSKPLPITCNPVLDAEQYQEYLEEQEAEKAQADALALEKAKYSKEANKDVGEGIEGVKPPDSQEEAGDSDILKTFKDAMVNSVKKGFGDVMDEGTDGDNLDLRMHFKVLKNQEDIQKLIEELHTGSVAENPKEEEEEDDLPNPVMEPTVELMPSDEYIDKTPQEPVSARDIRQATRPSGSIHSKPEVTTPTHDRKTTVKSKMERFKELINKRKGRDEGDMLDSQSNTPSMDNQMSGSVSDEEEFMKMFDKGVDQLVRGPQDRERLARMKNSIKDSVSTRFGEIVDEAQAELRREGFDGPVNRKEAFSNLASTLDKLLNRLEKSNKELDEVDKRLREAAESAKTTLDEQRRRSAELLKKMREKHRQKVDLAEKSLEETEGDDDVEPHKPDDNKIRVRVTKVKFTDPQENSNKDNPADPKSVLGDEQKRKLEDSVRNELKKAGLDKGGKKIHIKIITSMPNDGKGFQSLSDEDSAAFNKMIVTILGGNQNEIREIERQQQFEESYNYVYKKTKRKNPNTPSIP